jgi:hypothetical protein
MLLLFRLWPSVLVRVTSSERLLGRRLNDSLSAVLFFLAEMMPGRACPRVDKALSSEFSGRKPFFKPGTRYERGDSCSSSLIGDS